MPAEYDAMGLDWLRADLGEVERMLATMHPSRVLERLGFKRRRGELQAAIERLESEANQ